MHDVTKQNETFMTGDDLLAQYANGRRDFSNLSMKTYLTLDDCDLRDINFTNCWLDGSFKNSNLENAIFVDACVKTAFFNNANLNGADFSRAMIDATEFENAKIQSANFEGATAYSGTYRQGELPP